MRDSKTDGSDLGESVRKRNVSGEEQVVCIIFLQ